MWRTTVIAELGERSRSLVVALSNDSILILGGSVMRGNGAKLVPDGVVLDAHTREVTSKVKGFAQGFMCASNQYCFMSNQRVVALIDDFLGTLKVIEVHGHVFPQIKIKQNLDVRK